MNDVLLNQKLKLFLLVCTMLIIGVVSDKILINNKLKELAKLKQIYQDLNTRTTNKGEFNIGKPLVTPFKKLNNTEEEIVLISSISASSEYMQIDSMNNVIKKYDAKNLLSNDYWCSAGNHGVKEEVNLKIEFKESTRFTSFWIFWAFAPGEYRVRYAIENKEGSYIDVFPNKFRLSIDKKDMNWWKRILSNPLTRWQYKSFDDRVELENPVWAKFIIITMRIPVNQHFGIYNLEFYKNMKSVVMIKSKISGYHSCLLLANGDFITGTSLILTKCTDAISFGDNRDLFSINPNGFITPYSSPSKCIESPYPKKISLTDCSNSEEYKDDRDKWIIEPTGLIISKKDPTTCLSANMNDNNNYIPSEELSAKSSSTKNGDNMYSASASTDYTSQNYWASEPTRDEVVYSLIFKNSISYVVKKIKIEWKFPAKQYKIVGLLSDGNLKNLLIVSDNREINNEHTVPMNDLRGIKIIMQKSSMLIEGNNIYGIVSTFIYIFGKFTFRGSCGTIEDSSNLWELIDIYERDDKYGQEIKHKLRDLNGYVTKMKNIQKLYEAIPTQLIDIIEKSNILVSKLNQIDNTIKDYMDKMSLHQEAINSSNKSGLENNNIGSSKINPASSCMRVFVAFPHKRSGFYWIKSNCMDEPLLVYCDFYINSKNEKITLDYFIVKLNPNEMNTNFPSIKISNKTRIIEYILGLRSKCAEYGLYPVEINTKRSFGILNQLVDAFDLQFDTTKNRFIFPIAIDYGKAYSEIDKPTGKFKSINDDQSMNIKLLTKSYTSDYESKVKNTKIEELISLSIIEKESDHNYLIAYVNDEKIISTQFKNNFINGVACSSNKISIINENKEYSKYHQINCSTNFNSEPFLSLDLKINRNYDKFIVVCPRDCAAVTEAKVFGYLTYTDNSSICRAAIQSGVISDALGGIVDIELATGLDRYDSKFLYQIESERYNNKYPRSFILKKHLSKCPREKFYNDAKSYNYKNAKNSSFVLLEESFSNKSKSQDDLKLLLRFLENNRTLIKNKSLPQKSYYNDLKVDTLPTFDVTTDNALIDIDVNKNFKSRIINDSFSMSIKIKELVSSVHNQLVIYQDDRSRGIKVQNEIYYGYKKKLFNLENLVSNIDKTYSKRIIKAEHDFITIKKEVESLSRHENFQEDFTNSAITTNYRVFNSLTGNPKENPAEWSYYNYNLNGHIKVIIQRNYFEDNRSGSHLIIRNREFYDFELKASVNIAKGNDDTFGVAFRYMNEFNYYIFEISKKERGFKRVRKIILGESTILDSKYDGGYNNEEWIFIKIRCLQANCKIYTTTNPLNSYGRDLESKYQLMFDINDNSLIHGTVAFTSMRLNFVLLDDISVVQLACTDSTSADLIDINTNNCSRHREKFKHFLQTWKVYNPIKSEFGPSIWNLRKHKGRSSIHQSSLIFGSDGNQEGTMAILENKICQNGKIIVGIHPDSNDNSVIGVVFKFIDENNFYVLEIFSEINNSKMITARLRKKASGVYSLLKINNSLNCRISEEYGYSVMIIIKNNLINAFIYNFYEDYVKIFDEDANDTTFVTGQVGLWTFRTSAYFDKLELTSFDDEQWNQLLVDENIINKKDLNEYKKINYRNSHEKITNIIKNFSWKSCLLFSDVRTRTCDLLFNSEIDINKCRENFCGSCCTNKVETANRFHKFLCIKQCRLLEKPIDNLTSLETCYNPPTPSSSVYNYCEKLFQYDFYKKTQCQSDMCRLCCVTYGEMDTKTFNPIKISDETFSYCQNQCLKKFNTNNQ